jgi:hypothetical protein
VLANGTPAIEQINNGGKWIAEWDEFHAVVSRPSGASSRGTKLSIPSGLNSTTLAAEELFGGEQGLVQLG